MARRNSAFTLIELLVTISIIALMAGMVLFATYSATETAKVQKTRALIAKLDAIIKAKWDAFKTRRLPVDFGPDTFDDANGNGQWDSAEQLLIDHNGSGDWQGRPSAAALAKMRLDVLHDLMRMDLPDRWTDVTDDPISPFPYVALFKTTRTAFNQVCLRKYSARTPTNENQGAELLYLIVMAALQEEGDAREVFKPGDVADTDRDGFPEFLDGWQRPIKFLRWPCGVTSELQVLASGKPADVQGLGTQDVTVLVNVNSEIPGIVNYPAFSMVNGGYVGGALARQDFLIGDAQIDGKAIARIQSYTYDPSTGQGKFTFSTPPGFSPFDGNSLSTGDAIFVLAPDPFDPTGIFPIYPSSQTRIPSFATYPLIYSGGPDKEYGIVADLDTGAGTSFSYAAAQLYPFQADISPHLIGSFAEPPLAGESKKAWIDNVHNHLQATK